MGMFDWFMNWALRNRGFDRRQKEFDRKRSIKSVLSKAFSFEGDRSDAVTSYNVIAVLKRVVYVLYDRPASEVSTT